jgi:glycolate oxidase iron-sulfur subunit
MDVIELLKCINCGFCLNSCPDYLNRRIEIASPRGRVRVLLISDQLNKEPPAELFQPCVGCLACVPSCPATIDFARAFGLTQGS